MADDQRLNIEVNAQSNLDAAADDVAELGDSLDDLSSRLRALSTSAERIERSLAGMSTAAVKTANSNDDVAKSADITSSALGRQVKSTNATTAAMVAARKEAERLAAVNKTLGATPNTGAGILASQQASNRATLNSGSRAYISGADAIYQVPNYQKTYELNEQQLQAHLQKMEQMQAKADAQALREEQANQKIRQQHAADYSARAVREQEAMWASLADLEKQQAQEAARETREAQANARAREKTLQAHNDVMASLRAKDVANQEKENKNIQSIADTIERNMLGRIQAAENRLISARAAYASAMGNEDDLRAAYPVATMTEDQQRAITAASAATAAASRDLKAATDEANNALAAQENRLSSLRYALYDTATTYGVLSAGIFSAIGVATGAAVSFENSFAAVRRTTGLTGQAADQLQQQLINLSTTMPVAFSDLADIAAGAGQLGVAANNVEDFTKTVSAFSATTNVSVSDATDAFGKLDNLLPDLNHNYEGLASAILNTGVNAAATESDIIAVAQDLAPLAAQYKFTSDQIIGLSSAFASLGVAPEGARSAIQLTMSTINDAVSEGGSSLEDFARISGMSADDFAAQWKENSLPALIAFVQGLQQFSGQAGGVESALDALGIKEQRAQKGITALANNTDLVNQTLADSAQGLDDTSVLWDQYGIVAETTAAKLQMTGNAITALFAALGEANLGPLGGILDVVRGMITGITALVQTPIGSWLAGSLTLFGLVKGAVLGYRAVLALATAGTLGMIQVSKTLETTMGQSRISLSVLNEYWDRYTGKANVAKNATDRLSASLRANASAAQSAASSPSGGTGTTAIVGVTSGATKATQNTKKLSTALSGLGTVASRAFSAVGKFLRANVWTGALSLVIGLVFDTQGTLRDLANIGAWALDVLANAAEVPIIPFLNLGGVISSVTNMFSWAASGLASFANGAAGLANAVGLTGLGGALSSAASGLQGFSTWVQGVPTYLRDAANNMRSWASAGEESAGATDGAAQSAADLTDELDDGSDALGGNSDALGDNADAADTTSDAIDRLNKQLEEQQAILDKTVRTTKTYADDVYGIWTNAFDVSTGAYTGMQAISDGWADISDNAAQARSAMADANNELLDISADKNILKYQLRVAETYHDELRAAKIRAELAEKTADEAEQTKNLVNAQDDLQDSTGTAKLIDMTSTYGEMVSTLLKAGYTGDALRQQIDNLTADFETQASAAGFSGDEIDRFTTYLQGFNKVADDIPPADVTFGVIYDGNWFPSVDSFSSTVSNEIGAWAIDNKDFLLEAGWMMPDGTSQSLLDYWNAQVAAFNQVNKLQAEIDILQNQEDSAGGSGSGGGGGGGALGAGGGAGAGANQSAKSAGQSAGENWWSGFASGVGDFFGKIGQWFYDLPGTIGTLITIGAQGVWNFFTQEVPRALGNAWNSLVNWFTSLPGSIGETVGYNAAQVWGFLSQELPKKLDEAWTNFTNWLNALPGNIQQFATWAGDQIWRYITEGLPNQLNNAWNDFKNWLIGLPGSLWQDAVNTGKFLWDGIRNSLPGMLWNAYNDIWNWIRNLPNAMWGMLQQAGKDLWNGIARGFSSGLSGFGVNVSGAADGGAIHFGGGMAHGGAVRGPGTGTSDTAGLYRLANGEHVLTAREVQALGGQGAVYSLRREIVSGRLTGLASGGAVGTVRAYTPRISVSAPSNNRTVAQIDPAQMSALVNAVASQVVLLQLDGKQLSTGIRNSDQHENSLGGAW